MSNNQITKTPDSLSVPEAYAQRVANGEMKSPRVDMTGKTKEKVVAFLNGEHKDWTLIENLQLNV